MKGRRPKINNPQPLIEDPANELYLHAHRPPASLHGITARATWKSLLESLAAENRKLPNSQILIVAGLCAASQLLADSDESIATDGILIDAGREGRKRNPALSSKIQALGLIRAYSAEIGLTPASASRLPLPPIEEKPGDFDEF